MNKNRISCTSSYLIFPTTLWKEVYYSHMTREETNSEQLDSLRSQNLEVAENAFEYNSSNPKSVSSMLFPSLISKGPTILRVVV